MKTLEQFLNARGINKPREIDEQFLMEFEYWLDEYKKETKEYIEFLDYMGFDYKDSNCVEVGMGNSSSIVLPYKTKIITDSKQIKVDDESRIINGTMKVYNSKPLLVKKDSKGTKTVELSKILPNIDTYMTQNPVSLSEIKNWEDLHNYLNSIVILGVYGSKKDKDMENKLHILKIFKAYLKGDYKEEYASWNGNYFYIVGSSNKVKIKDRKKI